ncbi:energy-coupling factor ABC transporter permease [Hahella ganghwensis]|uniref:energy-coupling factor ABC transporter permease n=1 Tax=Hahella ganghwensis TaxID=286420 RepID=UPI00037AB1C8|nr:energy-coupling factor ABC transporter permease [Hahella ganghwensis]
MECLVELEGINAWVLAGWGALILLLAAILRVGVIAYLVRHSDLQHRFLASILLLSLLWLIRYEIDFGPAFHFLGMTFVTLMLRGNLAFLAGTAAMLVLAILGRTSWMMLPWNVVLAVLLPVLITMLCINIERCANFRSFFAYIFINAFFGAALTIAVSITLGVTSCWLIGEENWSSDHGLLLTYLPLIMLPEGVINGMLVTGVMVYFPQWLGTFDQSRYK